MIHFEMAVSAALCNWSYPILRRIILGWKSEDGPKANKQAILCRSAVEVRPDARLGSCDRRL